MFPSRSIFATRALLSGEWFRNVKLTVADGHIVSIATEAVAGPSDQRVDTLLPALCNLHSHSFQRAMAGMTEHRVAGRENFWTWRETMYRFLEHLTPEHVEAIAALVFMEMQEAGYAAVGEFHYLHHQKGGERHANVAELSSRIFAAAAETGIGLTHLPVLYSYGGAGLQSLNGGQLRFGNSIDQFAVLLASCRNMARGAAPDTIVGVAPHSLRATSPGDLKAIPLLANGNPIHIHIAEQTKEVADIQQWLGARPVEWLVNNIEVSRDWCAIHATHMTGHEVEQLAATGAVAGLCPITEANLGDGAFDGPGWLKADGSFGVGSDSNVRISLVEELRTLEYSQRLRDQARNVMLQGQGSVGASLYQSCAKGGAQALGRRSGAIEEGNLADLVAINSNHVALCGLNESQLLDGLCFAAPDGLVTDLWSAGRHQVREGQHIAREAIITRFRDTMQQLRHLL